AWARAVVYNSALLMATAPNPATADTNAFSSAVNGVSARGYTRIPPSVWPVRSGDHPARRQEISQSMRTGVDGDRDRLSSGHRPCSQVCRKPQSRAIVPGANCVGQPGVLRRYGTQFEGAFAAQQHAYQARPQQRPKTVGQRLNDRIDIRHSVQSVRDLSQNFGAAMLLA